MKLLFKLTILQIIFVFISCNKNESNIDGQLIKGKWRGDRLVTNTSITFNDSTTYKEKIMNYTDTGYNIFLEFSNDSWTVRETYDTVLTFFLYDSHPSYSINGNRLVFPGNPCSTDGNTSVIELLTTTNLILYAHDTVNYNPLVTQSYRWYFNKDN